MSESDEKTEEHYENQPPPHFVQLSAGNDGHLHALDAPGKIWALVYRWLPDPAPGFPHREAYKPSHWERIDVPARVRVR